MVGLSGLLVVPCLGLVWPGPVLPALPATTTGRLRRPAAAAPPLLLLLARQARQAQARPSQGKAQQASQPSQGRLAGRPEFWIFFEFFFCPKNGLEWCPRALGGPGGYFPPIFGPFLANFFPPFFPPFSPLGALFLGPLLALLRAAALWGAPPVQFTLVLDRNRSASDASAAQATSPPGLGRGASAARMSHLGA